jgi:putative hemolysin
MPARSARSSAQASHRLQVELANSAAEYRLLPRARLPIDAPVEVPRPEVPAPFKGSLRVGAWRGGEPGGDTQLNTAGLRLFVPRARDRNRYARHCLVERRAA